MWNSTREGFLAHKRAAFTKLATTREDDQSRMLLKVVGKLDRSGEDVLDDKGVHLLAPEQRERKLKAIFGKEWGRLDD